MSNPNLTRNSKEYTSLRRLILQEQKNKFISAGSLTDFESTLKAAKWLRNESEKGMNATFKHIEILIICYLNAKAYTTTTSNTSVASSSSGWSKFFFFGGDTFNQSCQKKIESELEGAINGPGWVGQIRKLRTMIPEEEEEWRIKHKHQHLHTLDRDVKLLASGWYGFTSLNHINRKIKSDSFRTFARNFCKHTKSYRR